MYNRYLAAAEQTAPETNEPPQSSTFSGLGRTLNERLQGVRLDMDTMDRPAHRVVPADGR